MKCKICNASSEKSFNLIILRKYNVVYYQCKSCRFLQTEEPYWLSEAYSSVISDLDVGCVNRNLYLSNKIENIIYNFFDQNGTFLDYAGGYGLLVRLMRDKGFKFYWKDEYCDNIFAKHFEMDLFTDSYRFELITGFEVIEHLSDPYKILDEIFKHTDSFLFSTELQPIDNFSLHNWWYLSRESGQHISFYTLDTLKCIADRYFCNLYSDNKKLHLFTMRKFKKNPFIFKKSFFKRKKRESLLIEDFNYIKSLR